MLKFTFNGATHELEVTSIKQKDFLPFVSYNFNNNEEINISYDTQNSENIFKKVILNIAPEINPEIIISYINLNNISYVQDMLKYFGLYPVFNNYSEFYKTINSKISEKIKNELTPQNNDENIAITFLSTHPFDSDNHIVTNDYEIEKILPALRKIKVKRTNLHHLETIPTSFPFDPSMLKFDFEYIFTIVASYDEDNIEIACFILEESTHDSPTTYYMNNKDQVLFINIKSYAPIILKKEFDNRIILNYIYDKINSPEILNVLGTIISESGNGNSFYFRGFLRTNYELCASYY